MKRHSLPFALLSVLMASASLSGCISTTSGGLIGAGSFNSQTADDPVRIDPLYVGT